jgi:hypothetical protein
MSKVAWLVMSTAALLIMASCGGSGDTAATDKASSTPMQTSSPTASPSASTPAPPSETLGPEEAVHRVALTRPDLPDGFGPDEMQEGDEVDGHVSLDLCSADFPSEDLRLARHQVAFAIGDHRGVSNEVVAYEPAGVGQALHELRSAIQHCPDDFVPSTVAGVPDFRYDVEMLPAQAGSQPGTLAFRVRVTPRQGPAETYTEVFQPRGQLLSILYFRDLRTARQLQGTLTSLLSARLDGVAIEPNA